MITQQITLPSSAPTAHQYLLTIASRHVIQFTSSLFLCAAEKAAPQLISKSPIVDNANPANDGVFIISFYVLTMPFICSAPNSDVASMHGQNTA
jgi:hypothetical protein